MGGVAAGAWRQLADPRWTALWAWAVLSVFFALVGGMVRPAAGFAVNVGLLGLTAYLAVLSGFRILRRFEATLLSEPHRWDPLERTVLEFGLGLGVLIAAMFAMGMLGLYRLRFAVLLLGLLSLGPHGALLAALRSRLAELSGEAAPKGWKI